MISIVKFRNEVVSDKERIEHECPLGSRVGVANRYCFACDQAFDDPFEGEAHTAENGHHVSMCLFCEACEEILRRDYAWPGSYADKIRKTRQKLDELGQGPAENPN